MYGEKSAAKYFKVDFLSIVRRSILSLSLAREELSLTGGIFGAPPVPVSRLFVRGENRGRRRRRRRISRRVSIAGGGLLAFISGSVASQDPALSYAARPFYLRPIWQRTFNSMRLAHFVDYYTRPLYIPSLLSLPVFLRRILGITLARELPPGNGRHSRFDHRSVPSPFTLSSFFFSSWKRLWSTIRKHFSNFFSRRASRRRFQLINSRMDVGDPSPSIFEISIFGRYLDKERVGETYRETELDRSKILAIRVA